MVGDPGSMQKKRSRTPDVLKVVLRHQLSIANIIIVTVGVINDLSLSITNSIITVTIRALDGSSEGDSLSLAGDNYRCDPVIVNITNGDSPSI